MQNSVIINSPDRRRSVWRLAVGFVVGLAIIGGLAHVLREDPAEAQVVTPAAPVESTPPSPAPMVVTEPAAPEPRRTKRRHKKPSGASIEPSLPESPTPSRMDLDAPLPH